MQKRGLKGVQMRLQEDRSRDAAVASRQRLKLTGKPEKPICAMESGCRGRAASTLLFITHLFAKGCLPGCWRQILPARAAPASLSICHPAPGTASQVARGKHLPLRLPVRPQGLSSCLLLLPHLPPSLLWTNTISHFGSQNGTGCFPSTAQTGCRAHHSMVKPQCEAGQAATTRGARSYLVCPPCVPLTSCLRVLPPVNSPQGERQACGSALGMAGKRLKAKR